MYLLIHEDSTIQTSTTFYDSWLYSVDAGCLTVIKFENKKFLELCSNDSYAGTNLRREWKSIGNKEMSIELKVGTTININDECNGIITKETDDKIYIESECFTGWAMKKEILEAIDSSGFIGE